MRYFTESGCGLPRNNSGSFAIFTVIRARLAISGAERN
jgi:hypothetical protein